MSRDGRRRLRSALLAAVCALYVLSVPWYRDAVPGEEVALWGGLPEWVAVALACYAAAAVLNAAAWWLTDLDDSGPGDTGGEAQ